MMQKHFFVNKFICVFTSIVGLAAYAGPCEQWAYPSSTGELNSKIINESSGVAQSSLKRNRLYHINDSGDKAKFYITDLEGKQTKSIKVEGHKFQDVEDIDIGKCGKNDSCLYIADIGDNFKIRKSVDIILIKEKENYQTKAKVFKKLKLTYPDRAHNAEAMAIHPSGDLFIITKDERYWWYVRNSLVYKLAAAKVQRGGEHKLEYVGIFDNLNIFGNFEINDKKITSLDIHPSGKKFIVLSYGGAVEVMADLSKEKYFSEYALIDLEKLEQQEAISYLEAGDQFIYTTEDGKNDSPIMKSVCR